MNTAIDPKALTALLENDLDTATAHRVCRAAHVADLEEATKDIEAESAKQAAMVEESKRLRESGESKKVGMNTLQQASKTLEFYREIVHNYIKNVDEPNESAAVVEMSEAAIAKGGQLTNGETILQAICDTVDGKYEEGRNFGLLVANIKGE